MEHEKSSIVHLLERLAVVCLGATTAVVPAYAQTADPAGAEAAFSRGVADMMAGQFDSGCPAIKESYRLDPRPGTLFTLAECEAKWGRVASAVAHYGEYQRSVAQLPGAKRAAHREREQIAIRQLAALGPDVPKLMLVLPGNAPNGLVVRQDGELIEVTEAPRQVDPGVHVISVSLPSGAKREVSVTVQRGESKEVVLPIPGEATGQSLAGVSSPARDQVVSTAGPTKEHGGSGRQTAAYIAGGIGAAGLVTGSVLGLIALGKKNRVNDECSGSACNSIGMTAVDSGRSLAMGSNVSFGVGVVGLATSAVLFLTQPKEKASQPSARPRWQPMIVGQSTNAMVGITGAW